jgi:hypothetical protein
MIDMTLPTGLMSPTHGSNATLPQSRRVPEKRRKKPKAQAAGEKDAELGLLCRLS